MYHYFHLKTAFRGYKKSQVDQYIREKLSYNSTALSDLSIKLIQLEDKKKQLEENSMMLRTELLACLDKTITDNTFHLIKTELNTLYSRVDTLSSKLDQIVTIQDSNKAQKDTAAIEEAATARDTSIIEDVAIIKNNIIVKDNTTVKETTATVVEKSTINHGTIEIEEAPRLQQLPITQSIQNPSPSEALPTEVPVAATLDHRKVEIIDFQKDTADSKNQDYEVNPSEKGKLLTFTRAHQAMEPASVENQEQKDQVNSFWGLAVNYFPKTDLSSLSLHTGELFSNTEAVNAIIANNEKRQTPSLMLNKMNWQGNSLAMNKIYRQGNSLAMNKINRQVNSLAMSNSFFNSVPISPENEEKSTEKLPPQTQNTIVEPNISREHSTTREYINAPEHNATPELKITSEPKATPEPNITPGLNLSFTSSNNKLLDNSTGNVQVNTPDISFLNDDVRHIRQKYIVGKIAGEDLFDRNGRLIVARKSLITSEVVEYADSEGKLPELIINMILRDTE